MANNNKCKDNHEDSSRIPLNVSVSCKAQSFFRGASPVEETTQKNAGVNQRQQFLMFVGQY